LGKYGLDLNSHYDGLLEKDTYQPKTWQSFITADNSSLANKEAVDFLDKLLRYDHQERLTAKEAMVHPYFAPVREAAAAAASASSNQQQQQQTKKDGKMDVEVAGV